jgi:hypothetical protein
VKGMQAPAEPHEIQRRIVQSGTHCLVVLPHVEARDDDGRPAPMTAPGRACIQLPHSPASVAPCAMERDAAACALPARRMAGSVPVLVSKLGRWCLVCVGSVPAGWWWWYRGTDSGRFRCFELPVSEV